MAPTAGSPTLLRRGGSQQQPVAAASNSSNANLFPLPIALCGASLTEQPGLRQPSLHLKVGGVVISASAAASAGSEGCVQFSDQPPCHGKRDQPSCHGPQPFSQQDRQGVVARLVCAPCVFQGGGEIHRWLHDRIGFGIHPPGRSASEGLVCLEGH